MSYFPINLNISGKLCVVVGGGKVGERKVKNLLNYGAKVRVVSLDFTDELLALDGSIEIVRSRYKKEYIEGALLIFIATNDKSLNLQISKDSKALSIPVNIATEPNLCDFTLPSVITRGELQIAVSTDGKSPALSRVIKGKIEQDFGSEYETLTNIMGKIREKQLTISSTSDINRNLFYRFLNSEVLDFINKKDFLSINNLIKDIFGFEIKI